MNKTETPDFSAFLLSPAGRIEINLPNGDPMLYQGKRVAVSVYSPASAEYARAQAALQRSATSKVISAKKGVIAEEDSFEIDARFLESITAGIENFPYPGGAAAIYRERGLLYIGEQVRAYLNEQTNFFGKPKTS